jgi:pimeloyl-ACP methyl ester carboxylesterase
MVGIGSAIAVVVLLVLLAINTVVVSGRTEPAAVTVPGGRVLELPEGDIQVLERGPTAPAGAGAGGTIVLIHCFTCAIDWWDGMLPRLARRHRVVAVDLRGHGGSEKPKSGYTPPDQADLIAEALERLHTKETTVVGHSLGGAVTVALAQRHPDLVTRVAILDMPPDNSYGDLGLIAGLAFQPVLGEALWTVKADFAVRDGLEVAFAPGYDVPDAFVADVKRMTYTAYDSSHAGTEDYLDRESLDQRLRGTGLPLLVLMGAEEQIVEDPERALDQYAAAVPSARTELIAGAGHSPNVEQPAETAAAVLAFAKAGASP